MDIVYTIIAIRIDMRLRIDPIPFMDVATVL